MNKIPCKIIRKENDLFCEYIDEYRFTSRLPNFFPEENPQQLEMYKERIRVTHVYTVAGGTHEKALELIQKGIAKWEEIKDRLEFINEYE